MITRPFLLESVKVGQGRVRHQRLKPKPNGFDTATFFLRLRFNNKPSTQNFLGRYPRIDRPGLISVSAQQFGVLPHTHSLPEHVGFLQKKVSDCLGKPLCGAVELHTFPRVLGYSFNPVSFWYFHSEHDHCTAILCEVNNTFGERHYYLVDSPNPAPANQGQTFKANKQFYVSPFFPVSGYYQFRFFDSPSRSLARIDYFDQQKLQLTTSISGSLRSPTALYWAHTLLRYGWSTAIVTFKIHWQAIKLWLKGATFHSKPSPPNRTLTESETNK